MRTEAIGENVTVHFFPFLVKSLCCYEEKRVKLCSFLFSPYNSLLLILTFKRSQTFVLFVWVMGLAVSGNFYGEEPLSHFISPDECTN